MSRIVVIGIVAAFALALAATAERTNHYLRSIDARESRIIALNEGANRGLDALVPKVARLAPMSAKTGLMAKSVAATGDTLADLGASLDALNRRVAAIAQALAETRSALGGLTGRTEEIAGSLGSANAGLGSMAAQVDGIAADVAASGSLLAGLPGALRTTNRRLGHINSVVGRLGSMGVRSRIRLTIKVGGSPLGTAVIDATIIPPGVWRAP